MTETRTPAMNVDFQDGWGQFITMTLAEEDYSIHVLRAQDLNELSPGTLTNMNGITAATNADPEELAPASVFEGDMDVSFIFGVSSIVV